MPVVPPGVPLVKGWNPVTSAAVGALCSPLPAIPSESAFQAIGHSFPATEVASITTFGVAVAAGTFVAVDAGSGQAPLPIDLLRNPIPGNDPSNDGGLVLPIPAFGPLGAGLTSLDGFSTTAMVIAQTAGDAVAGGNVVPTGGAILAGTVTNATAQLWKGTNPVKVLNPITGTNELQYTWTHVVNLVTEPPAIQAPCSAAAGAPSCSKLIGLQPAVGVGRGNTTPGNLANFPPLEENTKYAVVVTTGVKDATNQPLVRSSVAKILLGIPASSPLALMKKDPVDPGDKSKWTPVSLLGGIDSTTAWALQKMRGELLDLLGKASIANSSVAMAYTFKTQTNKAISASLAAIPYLADQAAATALGNVVITPVSVTNITAFSPPTAGVNAFYDVVFNSIDAIDKSTGALNPALEAQLPTLVTQLHALVMVPSYANPNVAACPPGYPAGLKCPMLVVFGHGLNGSKETLFTNAATLANAGFVAAAIDFPLHGGNKGGAFANSAGQGDTVRPGICSGGTTPRVFSAPGVNVPSRYFVSSNFFRTRDAFRQNVLDVSALTLALNRPPPGLFPQPAPGSNPFANALGALGMAVNPTTTYYEGISLGGISGTSAVAANPRMSRALFSVPGGTIVDVFLTSPAFHDDVEALFATIIPGFSWAAVTPGDPAYNPAVAAGYLQLVNVAKWVLDPGDPINYASSLVTPGAGMPDFLTDPTFATPQDPKEIHGQVAYLDNVVPNTENWLLLQLIGGSTTLYTSTSGVNNAVSHGMLASIPQVQADAAAFLVTGVPTAATVTLP
jgi:hypothetical protein